MTIRTDYQSGDIGYLTYMHGVLYNFGKEFEVYVAQTLASFCEKINPEKERIWIVEYQSKIIASLALKDTDGMAQLRYFLIHPDFRGIGLGNHLMKLFMAFLKEADYASSFLLTEKQLETAVHIYEKYGYQYVSSNSNSFGLTELRYEMKLRD